MKSYTLWTAVLIILISIFSSNHAYAFTEQRKFIGQEFDAPTGLDYLNARYYNPNIGRFTSEDPIFWNLSPELLADPQQLNSYSYAMNNPINGSDPTGLIVVTVSGTTDLLNINNKSTSNYLQDSKVFQDNIKNIFPNQDIYNFSWSGENSDSARRQAAKDLNSYVSKTMSKYSSSEPLNFGTHSHGDAPVALYTQESGVHQIHNLITFDAPILPDYSFNENKIDNHINIYSNNDQVQRFGGNQLTFSGLIGAAIFGEVGGRVGDWIHLGEFGFAGRTIPGVTEIDATSQTQWWHPFKSHSELYNNQNVWDQISKQIK